MIAMGGRLYATVLTCGVLGIWVAEGVVNFVQVQVKARNLKVAVDSRYFFRGISN